MAAGLLIGIVIDGGKPEYEQGDFLVRGVVGADPGTGSVMVGTTVAPGQVVRLHARDAASADEDLRRELRLRSAAIGGRRPAGALVFSCNGRGQSMFGACDHDATAGRGGARRRAGGRVLRRRGDGAGRWAQLPARLHGDDCGVPRLSGPRGANRLLRLGAVSTSPRITIAASTVLLTGATGGIGLAIAQALAARGTRLILSGRRARSSSGSPASSVRRRSCPICQTGLMSRAWPRRRSPPESTS